MNPSSRATGLLAALALITTACAAGVSPSPSASASASAQRFDGVTLNLAAESDQYAAVLKKLAPEFQAATGAQVVVDILGYPEEYSKITADFVGHTANYDLVTVDIVWSGEFAMNGYTVDLKPLIQRDAGEIDSSDIYDVMWKLGEWQGKQVAFPMAGYANLLNYNKKAFDSAGLKPPTTMDELLADAKKLTDPSKNQYGITINGQKGPAGAQDFFVYNNQLGGHLLDANGKPTINSDANIANLNFFASLFKYAPPGAVDYDWGARETAFKNGIALMQEGWSVARSGYEDPSQSKIVGQVGTVVAPIASGMAPTHGFGGWGIGINKDSKNQDAAWAFIKWLTSKPIQKEWVLAGSGSYIRKSTLSDPDLLAKFPFQTFIADSFEKGDGDFRPRIPQYSKIQDIMGTAVNEVLHGTKTAKEVLDAAQAQIAPLFP